MITAFSALAAAIGLSLGVGASAEPDASIDEVAEVAEVAEGALETTTTTVPTTTTTVPTTTTTVPTTTTTIAVDEDELSIGSAGEMGGQVSRTADEPLDLATESGERIDAPGAAEQYADRTGETVQLAEPPPTPTTTTLPPRNVLPANSGEGRRIVYSKTNMWVWLVEADGTITRDAAVSGNRRWNLPIPGTYSVSSKSMHTCSIENPSLCWRYMVRFARGPNATWRDNIGFHEIPINTNTGGAVQGDWQLGEPLSGGCVRMATADATFLWNWAPVGTRVVVLP